MLHNILPIVSTVLSLVKEKREDIASKASVKPELIDHVSSVLEKYLTKEEKAFKCISDEIEKARQHDISTQVHSVPAIELLRGGVRPIITYIAIFWYVYARVNDIQLLTEDYAIISGIIAFWFGFRPFEKYKGE
ncbi:MAG: hypothetical protein OXR68_05580 [Alphaproteobacteria bacterium]|nr:hypothetical protein [Alphaproteobacteria bacterium]MDD9920075.1 hypothetical protein [Alphaproteobacteria bacterium]